MIGLTFPLRRAFLALPLEGEAKRQFVATQNKLREFEQLFSFQNPLSPHLTLFYWEELMQIEHADILRRAETIASKVTPFTIQVTGAGVFESRDPPRVLFLTIDRSEELSKLKKLFPWPNAKPFSPHITLVRMRNPMSFVVHRKKIMKLLKDASFDAPITCLRLYAEIDGVQQTPIQNFPFASL